MEALSATLSFLEKQGTWVFDSTNGLVSGETSINTELSGTFVFDDLVFTAGFRFGGTYKSDRGDFDRCLKLYEAHREGWGYVNGHGYFGDDKFKVLTAIITPNEIILKLSRPFGRMYERWSGKESDVMILKR
jgi:hypothetical protein